MQTLTQKNGSAGKAEVIVMDNFRLKKLNSISSNGFRPVSEEPEIFDIFLHPGEYVVATEPCVVRTLLGSCVAVTLWHPAKKVGAMSHCLLPSNDGNRDPDVRQNGKYCDQVVEMMRHELAQLGVDPRECQAKIFGGGSMYPQAAQSEQNNIGQKNGEMARRLLIANGIPIVSESLFGVGHRHISFDVSTGDVWVRRGRLAVAQEQDGAGSSE